MNQNRIKITLTAALLATLSPNAFGVINSKKTQGKVSGQAQFRAGELIIKYKQTAHPKLSSHIELQSAVKIQNIANNPNHIHLRLSEGQDVLSTLETLRQDPNIEYAQPNYIYHTSVVPNDPEYSAQWGLSNTGQTVLPLSNADAADSTNNPPAGPFTGKDMNLQSAWNYITDCSSVVVAVVDTGIKYNHQDLAANMWDQSGSVTPHHGQNLITGAANPNDPMDDNGHGTHVSGTIGAVGNNGVGTTGVCWKASLMAVKVLDATGSGTTVDVANGVIWAVNHGAKIINMSLGAPTSDPTLSNAITTAQNNNVIVVVAAGNDGSNNDTTATYPCNFTQPNKVCVAALDQNYELASFSNYGAASVDVGAPGVNISSTWPYLVNVVNDDFSSGWTFAPLAVGWGRLLLSFQGLGTLPTLADPSNYNGSSATYANNADHRAYKTFNTSTSDKVSLDYFEAWDTNANQDFVNVYVKGSGGDPMNGGTLVDQLSGTSSGSAFSNEIDLGSNHCLSSSCSIGFQLVSGASKTLQGAYFLEFELKKSTYSTNAYNVLEGTSMATPHVAGLAAMVWAFNPAYTYSEVISALKAGQPTSALNGKTNSGNAVNALSAISYIAAPEQVSAVKN